MNRFTTSSVFPDVNVWLALSTPDHRHFEVAWAWYMTLPDGCVLAFCRITQLGLLRLLTTQSVMGQGTLTQAEAWQAYDRWIEAAGAEFADEPEGLESAFRSLSGRQQASPKEWADAYLAAFSSVSGFPLVTFDQALAAKVKGAVLLG
ncbi:MAG: TA system VapC family ribonuclease toxin [Terracidiphilus sp.]